MQHALMLHTARVVFVRVRSAETISENVVIHSSGRMESVCGTHLGHNIPDSNGARFCIDLVCVAGRGSTFDAHNFTGIIPMGLAVPRACPCVDESALCVSYFWRASFRHLVFGHPDVGPD